MIESLTLLTFNVGLLSFELFGAPLLVPAPYVEERLQEIPQALLEADADIIALQEIYEQRHRKYLISALKKDYPHWAFKRAKNLWGLDSGLMFFSKYPIEDSRLLLFKDTTIDEKIFTQKGVLYITIKFEKLKKLVFYNTHTTAGGAFHHPESKKVNKIRKQEIEQLLGIIQQNKQHPSIIMGDLNAGPGVSEVNYRILLNQGFIDSFKESNHQSNNTPKTTWTPKNPLNANGPHKTSPPQKVDHIFLSKNAFKWFNIKKSRIIFTEPVVKTKKKKVTLSDHYALYVELELKDLKYNNE